MIGLIALMLVAQVEPGETRGAVYALEDGHAGEKLFDIVRRVSKTSDGWAATMEFRDPSGALAVEERVEFGDDAQPTAYHRRQHQTGGRGTVKITGDAISYHWRDGKGRTYREQETHEHDLMVGPMMFAYFQRHWSRIRSGEALKFRIMVPDRQTSYRFEFQKVGEVADGNQRLAKCELRLTGFLGIFVGDMVFYLDAATGDLVRYTGIVLPKVRDGSDWTNVKGVVKYERVATVGLTHRPK